MAMDTQHQEDYQAVRSTTGGRVMGGKMKKPSKKKAGMPMMVVVMHPSVKGK